MRPTDIDVHQHRQADHPIEDRFLRRWSPRALSGEPLPDGALESLFEAARWAPSSYNGQPWRFVYATRDSPHWDGFLGLLVEFNRSWARHAGALIVVTSRTTFERNDKPARTHAFDTGAAWMSLALQASAQGLVAHAMQGFDYERAAEALELPENHEVHCMVAVGCPGEVEDLPDELRDRETPSGRKPVGEIAFEAKLPG